jgi:hypothetical protein
LEDTGRIQILTRVADDEASVASVGADATEINRPPVEETKRDILFVTALLNHAGNEMRDTSQLVAVAGLSRTFDNTRLPFLDPSRTFVQDDEAEFAATVLADSEPFVVVVVVVVHASSWQLDIDIAAVAAFVASADP